MYDSIFNEKGEHRLNEIKKTDYNTSILSFFDYGILLNFGELLSSLGEYKLAIKCTTHAINLKPNEAVPYYNLANYYAEIKNYKKAILYYSKAINLNKNDYPNFYFNRGLAYIDLKDDNSALIDFLYFSELVPYDADGYSAIGNVYLGLKQYLNAISYLNTAINLNPKDLDAFLNLGLAYYYTKDYHKAISNFSKGIELNSKNSKYYSAYFYRGTSFLNIGNIILGIKDYYNGIKLIPKSVLFNMYTYIKLIKIQLSILLENL